MMDVEGSSYGSSRSRSRSRSSNDNKSTCNSSPLSEEDEMMSDLRRGPWTLEEDFKLINYIATHGEGRWNSLASSAGLKRTGKSCRLRWLNYLRPDVRRGNITLEEQLMILELHSRWGNRWSKIAQYLPGRTDNEIKNYWRTRVQKHAKQLKCDVNSKQFKDTMKYLWMPRLMERIQAANATTTTSTAAAPTTTEAANLHLMTTAEKGGNEQWAAMSGQGGNDFGVAHGYATQETSSTSASSNSLGAQVSPVSDMINNNNDYYSISINPDNYLESGHISYSESMINPFDYVNQESGFEAMDRQNNLWLDGGDTTDNLWNDEDIVWFNM